MPKRKEPELDPKEQFKRFQEAAVKHDLDQGKGEAAFKKIATTKGRPRPSR